MNVVMDSAGGFIEIQGTAEGAPFQTEELNSMLALAKQAITNLIAAQTQALKDN